MTMLFAAGFQSFLRLLVSLLMFLFVLAACYLTTVWIAKLQRGKVGQGNFEVLEVYRISNQKSLQIVRIGKNYYILSVTKDRVDKIDKIKEEDFTRIETELPDVASSFAQILEKVKKSR